MTRVLWDQLLQSAQTAHQNEPAIAEFVAFPDDIEPIDCPPFHIPAADLMMSDHSLAELGLHDLGRAFLEAGPVAKWRKTYEGTNIGQDFMDRFACYCLIGEGGGFISRKMAGYVVYMPPNLHYPWHEHPAEELYFILAGEAEFGREGQPNEILRAGDASFHASGQPHATTTHDKPMLAYVTWRNHLDTAPIWTPGQGL